ncbi:hypothetical protein QUR95_00030 [Candidatus Nasuia deltocephalinicola]|nr:hypothetical protein QUR95_00030 [Candidatus Nasuia deltocephalinicola]
MIINKYIKIKKNIILNLIKIIKIIYFNNNFIKIFSKKKNLYIYYNNLNIKIFFY